MSTLRGRHRSLDLTKKRQVCELISRGATLAQAAAGISVSVRTIQRETLRDANFDEQLRLAFADTADPAVIMQNAARAHWRAAAWLLERTQPDVYGKRPPQSASPYQFETGMTVIIEAALQATPPELRSELYRRLDDARHKAFAWVFPNLHPDGGDRAMLLPETPLADFEQCKRSPLLSDRARIREETRVRSAITFPSLLTQDDAASPQAVLPPAEPMETRHGEHGEPSRLRRTPEELQEMGRALRERAARRKAAECALPIEDDDAADQDSGATGVLPVESSTSDLQHSDGKNSPTDPPSSSHDETPGAQPIKAPSARDDDSSSEPPRYFHGNRECKDLSRCPTLARINRRCELEEARLAAKTASSNRIAFRRATPHAGPTAPQRGPLARFFRRKRQDDKIQSPPVAQQKQSKSGAP